MHCFHHHGIALRERFAQQATSPIVIVQAQSAAGHAFRQGFERQQRSGAAVCQRRGGSSSVDTVNSSIQVSGAYQGSIPDPNTPQGPLTLNHRGCDPARPALQPGNYQRELRRSDSCAENGWRRSARCFPISTRHLSETGTKMDLQTQGITAGVFGPQPVPTTIGPVPLLRRAGQRRRKPQHDFIAQSAPVAASAKAGAK